MQIAGKVDLTEVVGDALVYLALRRDRSVERNGDADLVKNLAKHIHSGKRLSGKQLATAVQLLQRYRHTQLQDFGFELPTVNDLTEFLASRAQVKVVLRPQANLPPVITPDGIDFWISSPYRKGLSEQQQECFDRVHEWFFSPSPEHFVIQGFSGVGKTYTVQRIVQSLKEISSSDHLFADLVRNRLGYGCRWDARLKQVVRHRLGALKVALCAPTHKAVEVLSSFAHEAGLDVETGTLHSYLGVVPGEHEHNGKQKLAQGLSKQDPYDSFGLMVIDEASMISAELLSFIPKGTPTLFMGDSAQLPPVDDEVEQPEESPVFQLQPSYKLTQVMRHDGEILNLATEIRNNLDSPHAPKILMGGNLIPLGSTDWEEELLETFQTPEAKANPNYVRVLAYRNATVQQLNEKIRTALYPEVTDRIIPGERLVAKEPVFLWDDEWQKPVIKMQTCEECVVKEVESCQAPLTSELLSKTISVATEKLTVDTATEILDLFTVHPDSLEEVSRFLFEFKQAILGLAADKPKEEQKRMRRDHWKDYFWALQALNLVDKSRAKPKYIGRLQYCYALTIHQSQGSTFQVVFADFRDILACRSGACQRNQLRYVALTRAAQTAVILS